MIRVSELSATAGAFRLRKMSLELPSGGYGAIVGPTGAGKTVLIEAIAGLQPVDSGSVEVDGRDLTRAAPEVRRFGYVPQDRALFPHMSVAQNIVFGLDRSPPDKWERMSDLVQLLGIGHLSERRPRTLSGGEAQRVALARALAPDPPALLLDEPLTGLDHDTRREMVGVLELIHQSTGATVLHVTHDLDEALALADHLGVIRGGQVLEWGSIDAVFGHPRDERVARSVGMDNLLDVQILGPGRMRVAGFEFPCLEGLSSGSARVAIRAGDVLITSSGDERGRPATVSAMRRRSRDILVRLSAHADAEMALLASCSPARARQLGLRVGGEVRVLIEPERIHLL